MVISERTKKVIELMVEEMKSYGLPVWIEMVVNSRIIRTMNKLTYIILPLFNRLDNN
jgi:hypothetical protein